MGELNHESIIELITEHHHDMQKHSPSESIHALDISALEKPEVTFLSLWIEDELAGVGAIKELDKTHAEIKSMRTSISHLRKGVAETLLQHILTVSRQRGYKRVSLETGTAEAFIPAHKLYQNKGFEICEPFEGYILDPNSQYMTLKLQ